jgi:hypothetical protein
VCCDRVPDHNNSSSGIRLSNSSSPNPSLRAPAKQSIARQSKCGSLRCARKDENPHPRVLAAHIARAFAISVRPKNRGRGECRVPGAPAASCARSSGRCTRVFTARSPITSGIPTQWFTAYSALSSAIGLFCHRRPWSNLHELDASVEASGPHGFAVRVSAVRYRRIHVHRIPPRVRDDREPPLWVGRDGGNK